MLFGDAPMSRWPSQTSATGEPWQTFVIARAAAEAGRTAEAVKHWIAITEMPGLESRHYLQAWHFLRATGVAAPASKAKELLGVVIEVPVEDGLDVLAAYPERNARYYNFTGAAVIWEHPNNSLDAAIDQLLANAARILKIIGPWDKPRPPAPRAGNLRINLLSSAGLHFGEGPFNVIASDPLARPTVTAATELMQSLVALDPRLQGG